MHGFTTEDLLLYLYKETSPEMTEAIKSAMEEDWRLKEKFEIMASASNQLEKLNLSPRKETIDFIMNYAEKSVEELHPHA